MFVLLVDVRAEEEEEEEEGVKKFRLVEMSELSSAEGAYVWMGGIEVTILRSECRCVWTIVFML